jgi:ubiquitin-conjugating enzyme E2 O
MDKGDVEGNAEAGKKVEEEEAEEEWNEDAMGNLTVGAILTLKRTVQALEAVAAEKGQAA